MASSSTKEDRIQWPRLGWLLFTLLACAHFSMLDLSRSPQFLNLHLYANGAERLPYQGRILMAWLLHSMDGVLGHVMAHPAMVARLAQVSTHVPLRLTQPYVLPLVITSFISMLVAVLAARASLLHLTGSKAFASWAALLTLYMAYFNLLTVYGLAYTLPYDIPSLAFFSVGVWLVLTRRYWVLLPVFILGTLNRETYCFMTVFLALYTWFEERLQTDTRSRLLALSRVAPHLAIQAALWLVIRLWIRHHFLQNPIDHDAANGFFIFQYRHNLKLIANPGQWPLFLSLFGFTLPFVVSGYRWIGNLGLARSVMAITTLWFVAMMTIGTIVEVRIFDELTAFFAPALGLILWNRWIEPASEAGRVK